MDDEKSGGGMEEASKGRVLIVARDGAASTRLAEGLASLGWPCALAGGLHEARALLTARPFDAVIVHLAGFGPEAAALTGRQGPPTVAVTDAPADGFDLVLAGPLHPLQIKGHLQALSRTQLARRELALRRVTLADAGVDLPEPQDDLTPLRILTIAEPAPSVLALTNALSDAGADVTNAFTTYTAFDYLQQASFDAVAMWAGASRQEAMSITAGLRRNTQLFHIPVYLQQDTSAVLPEDEAYRRGVSDLAAADTVEAEASWRILALADASRARANVHAALARTVPGLFQPELFAAHVARLAQSHRKLSVCVLKIAPGPALASAREGGWLEAATTEIGSMISRLVRAYDTATRLSPDVFALALPDTDLAGARAVAERIAAVVSCSAFTSAPGAPPLVVTLATGAAQAARPAAVGAALEAAAAQAHQALVSDPGA